MSVISSVKSDARSYYSAHCSVSDMSLASSALLGASSTCISDADYETSSEKLSPRIEPDENSQLSRCSSSIQFSSIPNVIACSQSSTILLDKSKEFDMSFETNGRIPTIKSDTYLAEQNKAISNFMEDMRREKQEQTAEELLSDDDETCQSEESQDSSDSMEVEDVLRINREMKQRQLEEELYASDDDSQFEQNKGIPDFIKDLSSVQQQLPADLHARLSVENSLDSLTRNKSFPTSNASDSSCTSEIDINFRDSLNSISGHATNTISKTSNLTETLDPSPDPEQIPSDEGIKAVCSTLSEAKHKIMENLADVTPDKLFTKPGEPYEPCSISLATLSLPKSALVHPGDHQPSSAAPPDPASHQSSRLSRKYYRSNSVESILRIDHELQPLNLMLSRLLAEFRAMDLRGRLGYGFADRLRQAAKLPEVRTSSSETQKREEKEAFLPTSRPMRCSGTRAAGSVSHEHQPLSAAAELMTAARAEEEEGAGKSSQTSRSCDHNRRASRDARAEGCQLR